MQTPAWVTLPDVQLTIPQIRRKFRPRELGWLGQTEMVGPSVDIPGYADSDSGFQYNPYSPGYVDAYGRGTSADTRDQIAKLLVSGGLRLAEQATLQPGTVIQTPQGTILRQTPGAPVPITLFGGNVAGTAMANTGGGIMVAALVGLGIVLLMSMKR